MPVRSRSRASSSARKRRTSRRIEVELSSSSENPGRTTPPASSVAPGSSSIACAIAATASPHGCRRATIAAHASIGEMLKAVRRFRRRRALLERGRSIVAVEALVAAPRARAVARCLRRCAPSTRSRSGTSASSSLEPRAAHSALVAVRDLVEPRVDRAMSHSGWPRRRRNRRAPIDGRRQVERRRAASRRDADRGRR